MEEEGAGGGVGQYAHDVQPVSRGLDAVKLFVGQLPRQLTEQQLAAVFSEAGTVYEINIIKDKVTKQSRGKRTKFTCSFFFVFLPFLFHAE
jgi:CUG-BP- and ETR3-like factor